MRTRWRIAGLTLALSAAPVTFSTTGGVEAAQLCADGTCCPENKSDCIINGILRENHYALLGGGSCNTSPVIVP